MAIYIQGKVTQMGQRYLWRVQERFRRRVLGSETVVLVGVRPWPADTHLWSAVFKTNARLLYVGGKSGFEELERQRCTRAENVFLGEKFEGALEALADSM
jgi:hypothetical protein